MSAAADPVALSETWRDIAALPPGGRLFRSRRLAHGGDLPLHLAIRAPDDALCLLVQPGAGTPLPEGFETGGLRLFPTEGPGGALLALVLEDAGEGELFATICANLVQAAAGEPAEVGLQLFLSRLDAWREFLRERRTLTHAEIVGIMGELLVLRALLSRDTAALRLWAASARSLRDFISSGRELEVKTSVGGASRITASTLDQFDEAGLESLFLVHVRLAESRTGATLAELVREIEKVLPGRPDRARFEDALVRRGLRPGANPPEPKILQLSLEAYQIAGGFPRLRRADLPAGVVDARYDIDVRALPPFSMHLEECLQLMTAND